MDTTVKNLDPDAYRRLKAWAAYRRMTVGEAINTLVRTHLPARLPKQRVSLADLPHEDFGKGSERLSEDVDEVLYGR